MRIETLNLAVVEALEIGFARLYWRVRIETCAGSGSGWRGSVSPAFIGGCGLKQGDAGPDQRPWRGFARLYWRVRIETLRLPMES